MDVSHGAEGASRNSGSPTSSLNHSNNRRNKRFQACVSCRATKTKCLPSERHDTCQSCLRSSRRCVMPGPAKPRMKSAEKFSELEKKVEMLTNALTGKSQSLPYAQFAASNSQNGRVETPTHSSQQPSTIDLQPETAAQYDKFNLVSPTNHAAATNRNGSDIIDETFLRTDTANRLFVHWNTNMRPLVPVVSLLSDVDVGELRKSKPLLFLTILTVASLSVYPSLSARLVTKLTTEFGQRLFVHGSQNTDIVLSLLLFSQHYVPPEDATNLVPSQYVYAASAMCSDVGLHTSTKSDILKDTSSSREASHICLSEWYAASTISTLLTRNSLIRRMSDLDKHTAILYPADGRPEVWQCSLLKLQRILEDASVFLDAFESKDENVFDQISTQYKVNMLRQQLEAWERHLSPDVDLRLKQHGVHSAYLQIHAIAVRCYIRKRVQSMQQKGHDAADQEGDLMGLTPLHFDCLTKCLEAVKGLFDVYLSFDIPLARCLPNSYLFWNINASIMLIKLGHFGEVLTKSQPSSNQPPFRATVTYYLDAIAEKMEEVSADGHLPQAKPFIKVIRKLMPYYLQKVTVCINSGKGGVVEIPNELGTNPRDSQGDNIHHLEPSCTTPQSANPHTQVQDIAMSAGIRQPPQQQAPSSKDSLSRSGWTPSSEFSNRSFPSPQSSAPYTNQLRSPGMNLNAAYDPDTYASTDWSTFALDQETVQQLDSFMWDDEDTAWMQSLL